MAPPNRHSNSGPPAGFSDQMARETKSGANAVVIAGRLTAVAMSAAGLTAAHAETADARPTCDDINITCPTSPTTTVQAPGENAGPTPSPNAEDPPLTGHPTTRKKRPADSDPADLPATTDPEPAPPTGGHPTSGDGRTTLPGTNTRAPVDTPRRRKATPTGPADVNDVTLPGIVAGADAGGDAGATDAVPAPPRKLPPALEDASLSGVVGDGDSVPADDTAPSDNGVPTGVNAPGGDDTAPPANDAQPSLRKAIRQAERRADAGDPFAQTYLEGLPDEIRNPDSKGQDTPAETEPNPPAEEEDPAGGLEELLTAPLESEDGTLPADPEPEPPALTPEQAQKKMKRIAAQHEREFGDSPWTDLYTQGLDQPEVRPEPAPDSLSDMDPEERDETILDPISAPMFTPGEREGARRRTERRDINGQRKVVRDELRDEVDDDALPDLLARPMDLRADQVDDPVLADTLCLTGSVTGCRPSKALTRLELDLLRESGDLTRSEDPDPTRRDNPWFKSREKDHREAVTKALLAQQPTVAGEEYPEAPDWSWSGLGNGILTHGKGLAVSSFQRSPLGLVTNPKEFAKENWNFAKGAGEGFKGIWDTGVMAWQLSPQGCTIAPDACADRQAEIGALVDYAKGDPEGFSKNLALGLINNEDLEDGKYSEWAGNLTPDALLAIATYGSGSAASGGLRGIKGLKALDDLPTPSPELARALDELPAAARTRALLEALGPGAARRLDMSPASLERLERMLVRSSTTRDGQHMPVHNSGAAAEVRVVGDYSRRSDVDRVHTIGESNQPGARSPDFVAEGANGLERVESTIVTVGRGSGYRPNGTTRTGALTTQAVVGTIRRKVVGAVTQFNAPLRLPDGRVVPDGGTLSMHLRRPAGPRHQSRADYDAAGRQTLETAREGIGKSIDILLAAKVRHVEVNLGGTTIRYEVRPNGDLVEQAVPRANQ